MPAFRADDFARGILLMRSKDFVLAIILSDDVEHVRESVIVVVAGVRAEQRLRHRPGWIGFMGDLHETLENALRQFGLRRVVDFVADAVKNDAWVIAVAQDGVAFVRFRPLVEIEVIIGEALSAQGVLAHRPAVEQLVHHQKSHAIAQIEKLRRGRIVRRADGIHAERFQGFQPFFPDARRHRCAKRAAVVMQADALDLEIYSVQPESGAGVEMKFADAERNHNVIGH